MKNPNIWLRILVSIGLIGIVIWAVGGLDSVLSVLRRIDPLVSIVVLIVITVDRALMTYKWLYLLSCRGEKLAFLGALKIYCASAMIGFILPTTLGADAIRAIMTTSSGVKGRTVIASIFVERMIGFLASLLLGLIALGILLLMITVDVELLIIWVLVVFILLGAFSVFSISFSQRLFRLIYEDWLKRFENVKLIEKIRRLHETYIAYRMNKKRLAIFFVLTFFEQLFSLLIGWLIAVSLGVHVSIMYFAVAIPIALLLSRLPISIDGIGVFEAVFVFLMSLSGVSPPEAVAIAVAARLLQLIAWSPWWLAYALEANPIGSKPSVASITKR